MRHVCHSTPTAGLQAALDVMMLDLYVQCVVVQVVLSIRTRLINVSNPDRVLKD